MAAKAFFRLLDWHVKSIPVTDIVDSTIIIDFSMERDKIAVAASK